MRTFISVLLVGTACVALAASLTLRQPLQSRWQVAEVTGHLPDLQFALTDDAGHPVTQNAWRGKIVLLYFGFTHCPDECPVTMARLAGIFRKLGPDGDRFHALFVTVDPARDHPAVLHAFIAQFEPAYMTGLTSNAAALRALARAYRTAFEPATGSAPLVHGDGIYIFDTEGHARLLATDADPDAALIADLTRLARESN